ncbi:MAG TPA: TRAM domain-containing protein [Parachlamydiaceae bacterium]|nr:TRAM domain-containing protein [Parachlamydiaceae bacterium]
MNISLSFIRILFLFISVLIGTAYATTSLEGGANPLNILIGVLIGSFFSFLAIVTDYFFKQFNLRSFNIAIVGLFIGCLMGKAVMVVAENALLTSPLEHAASGLLKTSIFLFTAYLGMCMTARAAEEFYVSIPFIKFKPVNHKKKDLLIDPSILQDSRILDLASCGLLDHHLILPRFITKELYNLSENNNEITASKARRALDICKKLENITHLQMRYTDTDFHDIQDSLSKLNRLARLLDANIITSDASRVQSLTKDGVSIININTLANALKPISQTGEYINIKVQHPGKGARQGVGYLDDGTMVVINGGADNLGEIIKAQVVSVKHTTSGRMIFCNSTDEELLSEHEAAESFTNLNLAPKSHFAL